MKTIEEIALVLYRLFVAIGIAALLHGRADADNLIPAALKQIIVSEALAPKLEPHYSLLNKFPVTVIVEYRLDPIDGDQQFTKGIERVRKHSSLKRLSAPSLSPLIEIRVRNGAALLRLLRDENVISVRPNDDLSINISEVKSIVRVSEQLITYPYLTGDGVSIAVIDTGVMSYAPNCTAPYGPRGSKKSVADSVIVKINFAADVSYGCWTSDDQHGTVVAEIIHAIAPKAKLIALRIGGDLSGLTVANMAKAVDWIVANRETYNIKAANISIGAHTSYSGDCYTSLGNLARTLQLAGVVPVVATGNDSFKSGITEPSCSPFALAVGMTLDDEYGTNKNTIGPFSNTGPGIDLVAPGCTTTTDTSTKTPVAYYLNMSCGTSLSAPVVSGAVALLAGMNGFSMPAANYNSLLAGATELRALDPKTNESYPVLDVLTAVFAAGYYLRESTAEPLPYITPAYVYWACLGGIGCPLQPIAPPPPCTFNCPPATM